MSQIDKEILKEFTTESKQLIDQLVDELETIEGNYDLVYKLEDYGQKVDRIMGGAKNLAVFAGPGHVVLLIGDYCSLCKIVGYKASQISNNEQLFNVCVAFLLDVTENLRAAIVALEKNEALANQTLSPTFVERLRWISDKFGEGFRTSVDAGNKGKLVQNEIDELLKKLGL